MWDVRQLGAIHHGWEWHFNPSPPGKKVISLLVNPLQLKKQNPYNDLWNNHCSNYHKQVIALKWLQKIEIKYSFRAIGSINSNNILTLAEVQTINIFQKNNFYHRFKNLKESASPPTFNNKIHPLFSTQFPIIFRIYWTPSPFRIFRKSLSPPFFEKGENSCDPLQGIKITSGLKLHLPKARGKSIWFLISKTTFLHVFLHF